MKEVLLFLIGGILGFMFFRRRPEGDGFRERREALKRITDTMPLNDLVARANRRLDGQNKP